MPNDICIVPGCNKPQEKSQGRHICGMHRSRWGRYKSYDLPEPKKLPDGIVKVCKKHGDLTESQTKKRVKNRDWLTCLVCLKECEERFTEKMGHLFRNAYRKSYYIGGSNGLKLSKDAYKNMLEKQNYVCAICKKSETVVGDTKTKKPRRLSIDHCHETLKIRGLLCFALHVIQI